LAVRETITSDDVGPGEIATAVSGLGGYASSTRPAGSPATALRYAGSAAIDRAWPVPAAIAARTPATGLNHPLRVEHRERGLPAEPRTDTGREV
jgi:hypothetical protein